MEERIQNIHSKLEAYVAQGKRLFSSSSFQTHSLVLLHILSRSRLKVPVYFLDTGYHFPETLRFRDEIAKLFDLDLKIISSPVSRNMQRDAQGRLLFTSDPDYCCHLNKTLPMDEVLREHDVWVNGVRRDQSRFRGGLAEEAPAPHGSTRYHPMLDFTAKEIYAYLKDKQLPEHPLDKKGFISIGCEPCTQKWMLGDERSGRWKGQNKTECGLHTELIGGSK
jgi:phosphoadenosine phosphosulfate reductase